MITKKNLITIVYFYSEYDLSVFYYLVPNNRTISISEFVELIKKSYSLDNLKTKIVVEYLESKIANTEKSA